MGAMGVEDDPALHYASSKAKAEALVRASGLDWTILKPSLQFGQGDGFFNIIADLVRLSPGVVPVPGDGDSRFQPIHVGDVARSWSRALRRPTRRSAARSSWAARATGRTARSRARCSRRMGKRRLILPMPVPLIRLVAGHGRASCDCRSRSPPTSSASSRLDNIGPLDVIPTRFGFEPRPMEGALGYLREATRPADPRRRRRDRARGPATLATVRGPTRAACRAARADRSSRPPVGSCAIARRAPRRRPSSGSWPRSSSRSARRGSWPRCNPARIGRPSRASTYPATPRSRPRSTPPRRDLATLAGRGRCARHPGARRARRDGQRRARHRSTAAIAEGDELAGRDRRSGHGPSGPTSRRSRSSAPPRPTCTSPPQVRRRHAQLVAALSATDGLDAAWAPADASGPPRPAACQRSSPSTTGSSGSPPSRAGPRSTRRRSRRSTTAADTIRPSRGRPRPARSTRWT